MSNSLRGTTPTIIDHLERPGGHIIVLLALIIIGCIAAYYDVPWAERIAIGAFTVLLLILGGKKGRR